MAVLALVAATFELALHERRVDHRLTYEHIGESVRGGASANRDPIVPALLGWR